MFIYKQIAHKHILYTYFKQNLAIQVFSVVLW